jgi:hypothetical protein
MDVANKWKLGTKSKMERRPTNRIGSSSITAMPMIGCVVGLTFITSPSGCFARLTAFHIATGVSYGS